MQHITKVRNQAVLTANNKPVTWDATFIQNNTKKPLLFFFHGFKGFKDWRTFDLICEYLAIHGIVVIKANFSHNGTTLQNLTDIADPEAFGRNNISLELKDITQLFDHILSPEATLLPDNETDRNRVILMGHSRGGTTAILKANEDSGVKLLITLSALTDYKNRFNDDTVREWKNKGVIYIENTRTGQKYPLYYQLYEDLLNNGNRFDVRQAAKNITIPWLIIHGDKDNTVNASHAENLAKWNDNNELFIIKNADHTYGGYHPYTSDKLPAETILYLKKVIEFVNSNLS